MYAKKNQEIATLLNGLSCKIQLLNERGNIVCPINKNKEKIPKEINQLATNYIINGAMYRMLNTSPVYYIYLENVESSSGDLFYLVDNLVTVILNNTEDAPLSEVFLDIVKQNYKSKSLAEMVKSYKLEENIPRTALYINSNLSNEKYLYSLLLDFLPLSEKDILIDLDKNKVLLIKDMEDFSDENALLQFAQAVLETAEEEINVGLKISIGGVKTNLNSLHESYHEALKAMEVGMQFRKNETIFQYDKLLFERFLLSVPVEVNRPFALLLMNEQTKKILSEEMLQTIDVFFEKNLNSSDAARKLFIHRNTLTYRLDKLHKTVGLDLRCFNDALTFKWLYELYKCTLDYKKTEELLW